jgi:uncharacterized protein YbcI
MSELTRGQIERAVTQRIQRLYRDLVGQRPSRVVTHLVDGKLLVILQDSISPVERLLWQTGHDAIALQLQQIIADTLKPLFKSLVEETVGVQVLTVLFSEDIESGFASLTALLADQPKTRPPKSMMESSS